jgi:hypothetical protein
VADHTSLGSCASFLGSYACFLVFYQVSRGVTWVHLGSDIVSPAFCEPDWGALSESLNLTRQPESLSEVSDPFQNSCGEYNTVDAAGTSNEVSSIRATRQMPQYAQLVRTGE